MSSLWQRAVIVEDKTMAEYLKKPCTNRRSNPAGPDGDIR
jgi:hypothetical protein